MSTDARADTDRPDLLRRLEQARARCNSAVQGSPEWDAAMAWIEELERQLSTMRRRTKAAA